MAGWGYRGRDGVLGAIICSLCIAAALLGTAPRASAEAAVGATSTLGTFTIDGRDNIFGAGHASAPNGGLLPVQIPLPADSAGEAIVVSNASGHVTMGVNAPSPGPDGGYDPDLATNVTSLGGISGVIGDPGLGAFLGGVFTSDSEPTDAPPTLNYSAVGGNVTTSAPFYTPLTDQLFFIGDGLTGTASGVQQQFVVPAGATSLWLGLV